MFKPEQFIDFAETIYKEKKLQSEAAIRTAISRPYYAVLINAKTKLEEKKKTLSQNELHKSIVEELQNYDRKLADKLEELNQYKTDADLNLVFNVDKELIPFVTSIAKSFNNIAKTKLS